MCIRAVKFSSIGVLRIYHVLLLCTHILPPCARARCSLLQVVKKEEHSAAAAAMQEEAQKKQLAQQRAAAARARRREMRQAAEEARRKAMAPKGVWGMIAAPIHALFGDSTVAKASPYLPA
jgi:membrane protein involved in colicin uptake